MCKRLLPPLICAALVMLALGCDETGPSSGESPRAGSKIHRAIDALTSMREGHWKRNQIPSLGWEDVGALLSRAESDAPLKSFPVNPFSSQSQAECSEGIMALWLVESIRRPIPGGYPSNNPLCLGGTHETDVSWNEISQRNSRSVARAYQEWWKQVESQDVAARRRENPLAGTGLHWH
jgi:hypothetical protein